MPHTGSQRPPRGLGGTLVSKVAERLRHAIDEGLFKAGDRLPTEAELTSQFDVSRTVVREAIAALRADGLVLPRQGAGVFVLKRAPRPAAPFQILDRDRISAIVEMLELRTAVEVEAAVLAAGRRSPSQEAAIFDANQAMTDCVAKGKPSTTEDFRFHLAIAEAANNPRFVEFLKVMGNSGIPRHFLINADPALTGTADLSLVLAEHNLIAQAISDRDEAGASAAMRAHLKESQERYRKLVRQI